MLMAVKNQFKVCAMSIKYNIMREMINKTSFISNVLFMILNNASILIQWVIIFSIKDSIGGCSIKEVILLWGFSALTFGISHTLFNGAYNLTDMINNGKLDSFLVQPKNVLLSAMTSSTMSSSIGDIIYGYIMLIIYGITFKNFFLYTFLGICGAIILTCFIVIISSFSFWFGKSDAIQDALYTATLNFSTYPSDIFNSFIKTLFYTIIPCGFVVFIPFDIITSFSVKYLFIEVLITLIVIIVAFSIFNYGLKRYTSSNLMGPKI